MRTMQSLILFVLIAVPILFLCSCDKEPVTNYYQTQTTTFTGDDLTFFNMVNAMRNSRNLPLLKPEKTLTEGCESHAVYMWTLGDLNHDYFWARYVQSYAYQFGEVVAAGYNTPQAIISAYENSPDHYSILISPEYTHIGIASKDGFQCVNLASYKAANHDNRKNPIVLETLNYKP